MRLVSPDSGTGRFPDPPGRDGAGSEGSTTRMLIKPVFTRGSDRRRKLLVRGGYLAAALCVAYVAMVLVSITASPSARPATTTAPGAEQTPVQQVTPQRPSKPPSPAPVVRRPVVPAPAPVTRQPPPVAATPTAPVSATAAPSASAKPTKTGKPSASKTATPSSTTAARA